MVYYEIDEYGKMTSKTALPLDFNPSYECEPLYIDLCKVPLIVNDKGELKLLWKVEK